ncbi:zinc transporter 10 isoform X2 [Zootermopsis nevadensis]|uniref:Zinc transporter 10 n=1 Tax=Zootermopsis nevadensis TaxID=136037 RepID=A0A067RV86_ZOONE|nr:zinc transporter 10 isoform X2 [Zootermopsis nevadensis]KDR23794.1 Zinc transporter 10 [Zootermopsis nevadensis]
MQDVTYEVIFSLRVNSIRILHRQRMAMKKWFRYLQPVQLHIMLGLTILFFLVQLVMSHMTHALTLLVDSYNMLCNLFSLVGCIITIKYGSANVERQGNQSNKESPSTSAPSNSKIPPSSSCHMHTETARCSQLHLNSHTNSSEEKKLKNTFGWARIDVLVMLIGSVFLASLCFSLVVEALQTLVHIEHHDEMHHPISVMCVGATGLLLNGLCYLLIGGYTFHQGSFLHVTSSGDVVLDGIVTKDSVQKDQCDMSTETQNPATSPQVLQRQGIRKISRDVLGCLVVIVCSLIVYFTDQNFAKFVDPALSIFSAVLLLILSYPNMKESGSILLQTIPDTINIDSLRSELLQAFPNIINVHDLHVWRLTATKVFSTAHIIFLSSNDYVRITKDVTEFFHDQGITQVTIQPEFFKMDNRSNILELPSIHENQCLVQCREVGCHSRHCCSHNDQELATVTIGSDSNHHSTHGHSHNYSKNHKKHVAARVKELGTSRKSSMHSDPALVCKINTSFKTISSDGDSRIYTCEDACSAQSNSDNKADENDKQFTSSTFLNTEQESVMNNLHKANEQAEITSNGYVIEVNDLPKTIDKGNKISTVCHSILKQETAVETNDVEIPNANSKSEVVNSEISYSIPCELKSPISVAQDSMLADSFLLGPDLSHDPVLLRTVSTKSDTVPSQQDTCDTEFPLPDSVSTGLMATKPNVPNTTKPETDKLRSQTESGEECVS